MNNIINKTRKRTCENCEYCYIKYIENGTKSYCGIDDEEVEKDTKPCGAHCFIN